MKVKSLYILALACYVAIFSATANAQVNPIKFKFEVDGKEVHQPFKIQISLNGLVLEPKIKNNSFVFPPEFLNHEKVDVRFISGKYNLFYEGVYLAKFNGEMVFGVDNKPFDEENISGQQQPDKELVFIYYIRFNPNNAEGTNLIVSVYK